MVFRRKAKTVYRFAPRRVSRGKSRSKSSGMGGVTPENMIIAGLLYGAGRETLHGFISPVTNNIAGGYGDELALGTLGYFLAKKQSGFLKNLGMTALIVESASLGHQVAGPIVKNTVSGVTGQTTQTGFVYT